MRETKPRLRERTCPQCNETHISKRKLCTECTTKNMTTKYTKGRVCPDCGKTHIYRQNQCPKCAGIATAIRTRKKTRDNYEAIYEHIGYSECVDCGNGDKRVHCFHHINPEDKGYEISDIIRGDRDVLLREVDKCVLLCANCHLIRHYKG